jgi:hypothetical protein
MATTLSKIANEKVRTTWVKNWTEQFLKGLQDLQNKEEIEVYCSEQKLTFETEVKRLSLEEAKAQKREVVETSWMNAAATHLSQIRNAIKAWQSTVELNESNSYPQQTKSGIVQQHYAVLFMNYPREFHAARKQPTENKKNEQRRNLSPINGT